MAYSISYSPGSEGKFPSKRTRRNKLRRKLMIAVLCCVVTLALLLRGSGLLLNLLVPGEPAVTVAAMENMAKSLKEGLSLKNAVEAFCVEILDHGTLR